nr:hypothetical protein Iba_chr05cCG14290 [Ipomoea batatas]
MVQYQDNTFISSRKVKRSVLAGHQFEKGKEERLSWKHENSNGSNGGMRHDIQVVHHHVRHNTLHKPPIFIHNSIRFYRSNIIRLRTYSGLTSRTNTFRIFRNVSLAVTVAARTNVSEGSGHGVMVHEFDNCPQRQRHEMEQEIHEGLVGFGENHFSCVLVYQELQAHG